MAKEVHTLLTAKEWAGVLTMKLIPDLEDAQESIALIEKKTKG